MKVKEAQKKVILDHLKKERTITSWAAISRYRITRLAALINVLRKEGHNIVSTVKRDEKNWWVEYSYGGQIGLFDKQLSPREKANADA